MHTPVHGLGIKKPGSPKKSVTQGGSKIHKISCHHRVIKSYFSAFERGIRPAGFVFEQRLQSPNPDDPKIRGPKAEEAQTLYKRLRSDHLT